MRPESLHITLKFIGEQTPEQVEAMAERLRRIESPAFEIRASGYGFFPTPKAPRVFWIGIHAGPQLTELAESVDMAVAKLGVPREDRSYSPHLTLARAGAARGSGSPKWCEGDGLNSAFAALAKRRAPVSDAEGPWDTHGWRVRLLVRVWLCFLLGAVVAGAAALHLHRSTLLPPIALLVIAALR